MSIGIPLIAVDACEKEQNPAQPSQSSTIAESDDIMREQEQNTDKKSSQTENNSYKINNSDDVIITEEQPDNIGVYEDKTDYNVHNIKREGYFFADEVKVDGETIFTIPLENQLENESELPKRKSRWGDRPQRRKKAQINHIFNPLQGLTTGNGLLSITAEGHKPGQQYENKDEEEEYEKQSRWGTEYEKTFHPPLLNFIPQSINDDDLEYIIRLYRLDEIQNKIVNKIKTIIDDEDCRSPSPAPIYNETGKRINTRDIRESESLQKEKYNLIEEALRINPQFIPPLDFKMQKKQKKIYLPEQNSEILKQKVIGQKGLTHKKLEQESGCKISIKGKGSGNGLKRVENDVNDKLHILLQAETDEQLEIGAKLVDEILRGEEKNTESNANNQVSIITGYLNEDFCSKCHQTGHRHWECTNKISFNKVELKCEYCGDKGHVSFDCKFKRDVIARNQQQRERGNDGDMGQRFKQFINEVEGDDKLLNNFGVGDKNQQQQKGISNTSFITDEIEIDPNMLMIKADQKSYDAPKESYSSGPSHSTYDNFRHNNNNNKNETNTYYKPKHRYRDNNDDQFNNRNNPEYFNTHNRNHDNNNRNNDFNHRNNDQYGRNNDWYNNNKNDYNRNNERNNDRQNIIHPNNRQTDANTPRQQLQIPSVQVDPLVPPQYMNTNMMSQFQTNPAMMGYYSAGFGTYQQNINMFGPNNPINNPYGMFNANFNNAPLQFNTQNPAQQQQPIQPQIPSQLSNSPIGQQQNQTQK